MLRDSVIQDIIQFLEHCEGNDPGQELIRSSSPGVLPYMGYIYLCAAAAVKDVVLKYSRVNDQVWTNITCQQGLHLKVMRVEGHMRMSLER